MPLAVPGFLQDIIQMASIWLTEPSLTGLHLLSASIASFVFSVVLISTLQNRRLQPLTVEKVTQADRMPTTTTVGSLTDRNVEPEHVVEKNKVEEAKPLIPSERDKGNSEWKLCCHATLAAYNSMLEKDPVVSRISAHVTQRNVPNATFMFYKGLKRWEKWGQAKITLKCQSEDEMLDLQKKARGLGLVACSIKDAGRTQIAAGSRTVLAIGPAPKKLIDEVTGHLKLY
ncbi:hypothetical protein HDV05_003876 [Chytridiales sp. JEL 0842]|nr:hypothetical protein HDV05_003876 [Chytridiales sp. JEL 0842]